jgi:RNA polymerase sigma factor (sigma-70 family)
LGDVTELLKRIAEGDAQAQGELYDRTKSELRKLALHWIKRKRAGEFVRTTEVIDRAFLKLMRTHSPEWPHRGAFYVYASRNILHIVIDELRALKRRPDQLLDAADLADAPEPVNGLSVDSLLTLQQALVDLGQALPEDYRAVVELRFLGECTLDEVAELLSISSRYKVLRMSKLALEFLRERLRPSFPELG